MAWGLPSVAFAWHKGEQGSQGSLARQEQLVAKMACRLDREKEAVKARADFLKGFPSTRPTLVDLRLGTVLDSVAHSGISRQDRGRAADKRITDHDVKGTRTGKNPKGLLGGGSIDVKDGNGAHNWKGRGVKVEKQDIAEDAHTWLLEPDPSKC